LSAVLGGVIRSCEVSVEEELDEFGVPTGTSTGTIVIADDCIVDDEEIGLMLSTTSANHFNFVAPDMVPGDRTIDVVATDLSRQSLKMVLTKLGIWMSHNVLQKAKHTMQARVFAPLKPLTTKPRHGV
jgi:hypothetical protein